MKLPARLSTVIALWLFAACGNGSTKPALDGGLLDVAAATGKEVGYDDGRRIDLPAVDAAMDTRPDAGDAARSDSGGVEIGGMDTTVVDAPVADSSIDTSIDSGLEVGGDAMATGFTVLGAISEQPYENGTATLWNNNQVFVTKGNGRGYGTILNLDATSGTTTATAGTADFPVWESPTATLLSPGVVLLTGGNLQSNSSYSGMRDAYVWDPTTMTVVRRGLLGTARTRHTASLLTSGLVLIAGGSNQTRQPVLSTAELFDPVAMTTTPTGPLSAPRQGHRAVILDDNRVLLVGGYGLDELIGGESLFDATALYRFGEIYTPAEKSFIKTGDMAQGRVGHTVTKLKDGRVLVTAGRMPRYLTDGGATLRYQPFASASIFDPKTGQFSDAGTLLMARYAHTANLLADGRVLILGGTDADGKPLASAELYDPASGKFIDAGAMHVARSGHYAVNLPDGSIVIFGGDTSIEIYR